MFKPIYKLQLSIIHYLFPKSNPIDNIQKPHNHFPKVTPLTIYRIQYTKPPQLFPKSNPIDNIQNTIYRIQYTKYPQLFPKSNPIDNIQYTEYNIQNTHKDKMGAPLRVGLSATIFCFFKKKNKRISASIPRANPLSTHYFFKIQYYFS